MRAVWFAVGIVVILTLGIWLFLPNGTLTPTTPGSLRRHPFINDTDLTQPAVSVGQVVAQPQLYQNHQICLTGYYQQSFEFSALSAQADLPTWTLQPPLVWVDLDVPTRGLECRIGAGNEKSCFGQITLCGIFSYSSAPSFGHLAKYTYQLGIPRASVNTSTGVPTLNTTNAANTKRP